MMEFTTVKCFERNIQAISRNCNKEVLAIELAFKYSSCLGWVTESPMVIDKCFGLGFDFTKHFATIFGKNSNRCQHWSGTIVIELGIRSTMVS